MNANPENNWFHREFPRYTSRILHRSSVEKFAEEVSRRLEAARKTDPAVKAEDIMQQVLLEARQ